MKEASQGYKALFCTSQKNVSGPKKKERKKSTLKEMS